MYNACDLTTFFELRQLTLLLNFELIFIYRNSHQSLRIKVLPLKNNHHYPITYIKILKTYVIVFLSVDLFSGRALLSTFKKSDVLALIRLCM